jgi:GNAT superfamily N-acetyltransferase
MPKLELHALDDLRDQAARLLATRYAAQRRAEPLLPEFDEFEAHLPVDGGLVATRGGDAVAFLAGSIDVDGQVAGHALLYKRPTGDLRVPAGNIDLAHAVVHEDFRGRGVGLALSSHVLRWAHDRDYLSMTTDWRSVNLLSSRFWPRRGWRPQYLRLYRAIP